jgi:hypothetical protein
LRNALGLEATGAAVKAQLTVVTDEVQGAVDKLGEIWNRGAEDGAALAEEVAPMMVMPTIETANQAKAAAKVVDEESKRILAAQQQLINDGVRLTEDLKTPYDIMREKVIALTAAQEAGKITAEQLGEAQQRAAYVAQNAYASMASSIVGSLEDAFGQSKAVAIAQALINTYQSFTNAMANIPAPFNIPAAAAALTAGLAQVANIRKTNKSSKGGGGASASGGGGSSGGGQAPQAGVQQSLVVQGIRPDQIFSGDGVRGLVQQLLEYQRDGGKVILA